MSRSISVIEEENTDQTSCKIIKRDRPKTIKCGRSSTSGNKGMMRSVRPSQIRKVPDSRSIDTPGRTSSSFSKSIIEFSKGNFPLIQLKNVSRNSQDFSSDVRVTVDFKIPDMLLDGSQLKICFEYDPETDVYTVLSQAMHSFKKKKYFPKMLH